MGNSIKTMVGWVRESFNEALRVSDNAAAQRRMGIPTFAWFFVILVVLSFTMLWLGDKLNAEGMVVTRFMARVQAPLTSQWGYPAEARDQITVVMYDQEFLKGNVSSWPISYQDHADWLLRLASDFNARPKAIMLDITFGQNRNDPTLPILKQALCTLQNEFKVPVFLAALSSPENGQLTVRSGLSPDRSTGEPDCFTLVGVDYIPDPLDGLAWSYQLSRHRTDAGWQPGPASSPAQQPSYRSAAMAMAQDVAHIDLGEETSPMSLVWGRNSAPQTDRPDRWKNCLPGVREWKNFIPSLLRQFWEEPSVQPLCPYHRTLSMMQLGELSEQELAPYLAGRYVMVGANVPGYNDFVDSPVHRLIPGVYLHAMALDNFLTYKGSYKLSTEWTPWSIALLVPGLLTIFIILSLHVALRKFFRWTRLRRWYRLRWGLRPMRSILKHLFDGLAWATRMTLQSVTAIVLIVLLQYCFRIGMLPVVELVGMTLVAEGFGYMKKLRLFIYGK